MPRTAARVSQADIARAVRAAKQAGASQVEIRPDGTIVIHINQLRINHSNSQTISNSNSLGEKTSSIMENNNNPLSRYYEQLGFDPETMDHSDLMRLRDEAHERWCASIPGTPLNKRERHALLKLSTYEVGKRVGANSIKGLGPDTSERLQARGFIEAYHSSKWPDRIEGYSLTEVGLSAIQAIEPE